MKTLHVTTPDVTFDVEVPADSASVRAAEIAVETAGTVTL